MKIIISPAKTMNVEREAHDVKGLTRFLDETKLFIDEIKKLSFDDAKRLWNCNDRFRRAY
ncbi:MAG: peroxide stress protein YaaA [Anaerovoracaceae bacterium]